MTLREMTSGTDAIAHITPKTLLIVGPTPPPMGGATATVQVFLEELVKYSSVQTSLVNTRMPLDYKNQKSLVGLESLQRAVFITRQYLNEIRRVDAVLVFANNSFILTLVPWLLLIARLYRKSFYLKPIGGDLDLYLEALKKPVRSYLLGVLRLTDGILTQTQQLQSVLTGLGCKNSYYIPGCRPLLPFRSQPNETSENLRLIFLSQIKLEKGPLILLETLRLLAQKDGPKVTCDFYGPIFEEGRQEFLAQLKATPGAKYCGEAEVGAATAIISTYDALVLPTYFKSEGHPGVIIEAMQAGVPVITTNHRAIPELITDGENGLLVPVRDSKALAGAIEKMALDRSLRARMGAANYRKGQTFQAAVVVPKTLELIFSEYL